MNLDDSIIDAQIFVIMMFDDHYRDIIQFLSTRYAPKGVLLNFVLENEVERIMYEFHKEYYGGKDYWKTTMNKTLRFDCYQPTNFPDVYKEVAAFHEFQFSEGRGKLIPLPLKPICVEAPFQQWGL